MKSAFDLTQTYAIVTGGAGLLGQQFCRTLADAGALVACFDIRPFPEHHPSIESFIVDTTDKAEVSAAFERLTYTATPSILINNVGLDTVPSAPVEQSGAFETYPESAWDTMLDSHLTSALLVSQQFVKQYRKADFGVGSIINISSIYGVVAPDQSVYQYRRDRGENFYKPVAYTVAKAGMIGFTKWLAEYGGPYGIRANTLVLGGVLASQEQQFVANYISRTMLGRMAMPNEFNGALLFLASNASSYMTGAELVIDGGWTAR